MDRNLVLKLLGKRDIVILEDIVVEIINILDVFRGNIIKENKIEDINNLQNLVKRLEEMEFLVVNIKESLEKVQGYTNSKAYLQKYINEIEENTRNLIKAIEEENKENFILYTNILMDLVLKY
ncbi:hypothetical protein [uncultured Clostridium sp.]|uniref:hypothetical protein n=1 Tax=uncultured Clostridium sp. TaxID=59620 RepID=UPI00260E5754|nr:hypothetical protein [uncultured Clostridium sp.]